MKKNNITNTDTSTVWTIQPLEVLVILTKKKVLLVEPKKVYNNEDIENEANEWLAKEIQKRIPHPIAKFPWWAWYYWDGIKTKKPDLRSCKSYISKNEQAVLIELNIPTKDLLFIDNDKWFCVLNKTFLALNEKEDDEFNDMCKLNNVNYFNSFENNIIKKKITESWQRMFDLDDSDGWYRKMDTKKINANFWELKLSQVVSTKVFKGKGNPKYFSRT